MHKKYKNNILYVLNLFYRVQRLQASFVKVELLFLEKNFKKFYLIGKFYLNSYYELTNGILEKFWFVFPVDK